MTRIIVVGLMALAMGLDGGADASPLRGSGKISELNIRNIDAETTRALKLGEDFRKGSFKKYCRKVKEAQPLSCFASYLEDRAQTKPLSITELSIYPALATKLILSRQPAQQDTLARLQTSVAFISVLSGFYSMSFNARSLVPVLKAKSAQDQLEVEQLQSLEQKSVSDFQRKLREELLNLSRASRTELGKVSESIEQQELLKRLSEIEDALKAHGA